MTPAPTPQREPFPVEAAAGSGRWLPPDMPPDWDDAGGFRYLVVDERIEGTLTLGVSDWPTVDERGRLVFDGPTLAVHVREADLAAFLAEARERPPLSPPDPDLSDAQFRARPIRVGDAFAARERADPAAAAVSPDDPSANTDSDPRSDTDSEEPQVADPRAWLEPPVYDITAEVRAAAKLAFYAAASAVLPVDTVAREVAGLLSPDPFDVLAPLRGATAGPRP